MFVWPPATHWVQGRPKRASAGSKEGWIFRVFVLVLLFKWLYGIFSFCFCTFFCCFIVLGLLPRNPFYFLLCPFQIETLPPELFQCKKLRTLNLGNNCLQTLPSRFGELTGLTQLELRGNRLECLPVELGECRLLKRSGLVVEEDLFNTLPSEVKEQLWRADKEQAWAEERRRTRRTNREAEVF